MKRRNLTEIVLQVAHDLKLSPRERREAVEVAVAAENAEAALEQEEEE